MKYQTQKPSCKVHTHKFCLHCPSLLTHVHEVIYFHSCLVFYGGSVPDFIFSFSSLWAFTLYPFKKLLETSLVAQWLRFRAPDSGSLDSIPDRGTRSHMLQLRAWVLQLKILNSESLTTTTKTQNSNINKYWKTVISSSAAILFECPVQSCESFLEKSARSENAMRVC